MNVSSQDINDFLLQYKTVSLEKIGVIDLNNKEENDVFKYDKHAETSPEFLRYLVEKKGKPLSIVLQDIEYFLDQSRQLMNIRAGNLIIGEIGYIYANNAGEYAFSTDSSELIREADKKTFEDMYARSPLTSSVNYAAKRNKKLWRIVAAILIIGAVVAYGAYYVHTTPSLFNNTGDSSIAAHTPPAQVQEAGADSQPPEINNRPKKGFKFIIQTFEDALNCQKRSQQLKNYGNDVFKDTVNISGKPLYRLFVTDTSALAADTAHIKDSLHAYFGHPVSVE